MYVTLGNPRTRRRLRGLGYESWLDPFAVNPDPSMSIPAAVPDATSCSTIDFFLNPSAWQACANKAGQAQIQSVPANALAAGYSPAVVAAAQAAADQQASLVPADTASIATSLGAGQLLNDLTSGTALPTWAWALIAVGGAILVIKFLR